MYRNELYHFGVKGMRWGVRKDRSSGGMSRRQTRKAIKQRRKEIEQMQRQRYVETDITKMSDNELRNLNNRIQMENTYKSGIQSKTSKFGKNIVDTLFNSGNSIAGKLVTAVGLSAASVFGAIVVEKMAKKMASKVVSNMKDYKDKPEETKKKVEGMAVEAVDLYKKYLKPKKG